MDILLLDCPSVLFKSFQPPFLHLFLFYVPPSSFQTDDITHCASDTRVEDGRRRCIWCLFKSFLMEPYYDKG